MVFIGAEVRFGLRFDVAQARLANLARGGLLRHASDDAYRGLGPPIDRPVAVAERRQSDISDCPSFRFRPRPGATP